MESYLAVLDRIHSIRSQFVPAAAPAVVASSPTGAPAQSFAEVLASAEVATAPSSAAAAQNVGNPRGYAGLTNGNIPAEMLTDIGDGHRLHPAAAVQWDQMRQAMLQDGIRPQLASSYRTVEHQQRLVDELGLFSSGGLAAAPGHSNHGWGISVDIDNIDAATSAWLDQNAAKYGWVNDVAREPWHWTFQGDPATMGLEVR